MSTLLNYINELDCNADLLAAHNKNPVKTMKDFGLNEKQIEAFMSGDKIRIAKEAGITDPEFIIVAAHVQQK
ncbi:MULTISPECIES: hypothetical protein [Ferrimonas]|uniref:hypothetical protein n=1 Tax=Ferrimonas TaxID=44011 RepID=UPI0003F520C8|nr:MULTISPECIES: hypothetical protein [Ferrimonas]USD39196.1 hypothetical protein J8Z22_08885 [Ferrimonas sp. SCSIO 43195]